MVKDKLLHMYMRNKQDSIAMLATGVSMVVFGWVCFYYMKGLFWFGLSIPLFILAAVQLARGLEGLFMAKKRVKAVSELNDGAAEVFAAMDLHRIRSSVKRQRRFRYASSGLIVLGLFLLLGGLFYQRNGFTIGSGMGLMLQSGILLAFEMIYVWRHEMYTREIDKMLSDNG